MTHIAEPKEKKRAGTRCKDAFFEREPKKFGRDHNFFIDAIPASEEPLLLKDLRHSGLIFYARHTMPIFYPVCLNHTHHFKFGGCSMPFEKHLTSVVCRAPSSNVGKSSDYSILISQIFSRPPDHFRQAFWP
jgi:hypothetical protein